MGKYDDMCDDLGPSKHTCWACGVQAECAPWGGRFFCVEQCYDAACGDEPAYSEDEADAMGCDALMWEELP